MLIFLSVFSAALVWELILLFLNQRYVKQHYGRTPEIFSQIIDAETAAKSSDYTMAKQRLNFVRQIYSGLIIIGLLLSGAFGLYDSVIAGFGWHSYFHGIFYIISISMIFTIVEIPFSIYMQFNLEERFGFNRMTPGLFIADLLKGFAMQIIFNGLLLLGLFWFLDVSGAFWWIWASAAFVVFQLFMMFIYPIFIAPLFNKFDPLEDGELKDALFELSEKLDFPVADIFVMDGSKRSSHSNAYFTGFGASRRIVLFDTLIEKLSVEELCAVLAHEIGHYKKGHIVKRFVSIFLFVPLTLFVFDILLHQSWLFESFSFSAPQPWALLVILMFAGAPIGLLLSPVMNWTSRKHEYEADAYAKKAMGSGKPLIDGLLALTSQNLSNLWPHPLYELFYYSHPSLQKRVKELKKQL